MNIKIIIIKKYQKCVLYIIKTFNNNIFLQDGNTSLILTGRSWRGDTEIVKLLIDAGVSVNAQNEVLFNIISEIVAIINITNVDIIQHH